MLLERSFTVNVVPHVIGGKEQFPTSGNFGKIYNPATGLQSAQVSVCVAVGGVGDHLVDAIESRMPAIKVGDGMDASSETGPLVTREHRDKVASYIDGGEQAGARVLVDGRDEIKRDGFFLGCSLLDHVTPAMTVWTDEIFGPVLSVVRVDTYPGALDLGFPQNR